MSAIEQPPRTERGAIPELTFAIEGAESLEHAAVPTLAFALRVGVSSGHPIRSILLDVQIQIAARGRGYDPDAQERLRELFGAPQDWSANLRTLPWLRTTAVVPAFSGSTVVALHVPCTYDLEVTAARYIAGLSDGFIPLELLFSGSIFFAAETGALQVTRIAWDHEVQYRLPVAAWRRTIDAHFPHSAWLRLDRARLDRLCAFKARHAFTSWDAAIDALLEGQPRDDA